MFQEVGASTVQMGKMKTGDAFMDFVGPLGKASELITDPIEETKAKKTRKSTKKAEEATEEKAEDAE